MEDACPFSGKPCGYPKSILIKHVGPKGLVSLPLCGECGQEALASMGMGYGSVVTPGMLVHKLMNHDVNTSVPPCPVCGFHLADLRNGKMGCDHCYTHYQQHMELLLSQVHEGASHHCGKSPKNTCSHTEVKPVSPPEKPIQDEAAVLVIQEKLDRAVRDERYEDAAKLRDIIRELKKIP